MIVVWPFATCPCRSAQQRWTLLPPFELGLALGLALTEDVTEMWGLGLRRLKHLFCSSWTPKQTIRLTAGG